MILSIQTLGENSDTCQNIFYSYAGCRYADCLYAKCRCAMQQNGRITFCLHKRLTNFFLTEKLFELISLSGKSWRVVSNGGSLVNGALDFQTYWSEVQGLKSATGCWGPTVGSGVGGGWQKFFFCSDLFMKIVLKR